MGKSPNIQFGMPKKYNDPNLECKFFEIVLDLMGRLFPLPTDANRLKEVHNAVHALIHFEGQLAKVTTNDADFHLFF